MTRPTLPQDDRNKKRRARQLARQQAVWKLDKSYHGLVFADPDSVVRSEEITWFGRIWRRFSWGFGLDAMVGIGLREMLTILWHKVQTAWNNFWARWAQRRVGLRERWITRIMRWVRRVDRRITARMWHPEAPDRTPPSWTERQPLLESQLALTLPKLPKPAAYRAWDDDRMFAWERVAGQVPIMIRHVPPGDLAALQAKLPISGTRYAEARPGDALDAADEEGRLFVVDFELLDGIETGVSFGWRKWMTPAIGLFALTPDRRELLPVAVQCGQDPTATPYFTPADGEHWRWAKIHFQVAESNYHGVVEHGTLCHMLVGAIGIAAQRQLAPNHPIRVLLDPHLEHTLGVNIATRGLFSPGGLTTELQSVSLEGTVRLSSRAWRSFDWAERSTDREFARRGVLDADILPTYPFRDDSQLVAAAINRFVSEYVDLYYRDDAALNGDDELRAWFEEIRSTDGPDAVEMPTVTAPASRADLIDFLTDLLWRISPYHAVINYRVYESMGFVPFTPTAAYAPPPDAEADYEADDWLWLMPPQEGIEAQIEDTWNVANTRMNRLGHYGQHFSDPRVAPLVAAFMSSLDEVEQRIAAANGERYVPFTTLLPSNLTNSIHV